ncbi:MAG: Calx-beta domain-containing protein, partial [Desulfotomaculaceae bacterium]|nr:Calx-beta domain-containing protein [Desulfotomaculaceae bacterium]
VTFDDNNKDLAITGNTPDTVTVTVPENITGATINVKALLNAPKHGIVTTNALPALTISIATSITSSPVIVNIPAGATVSADASANWNGVINVPTVQPNNTVDINPGATTEGVIEIGLGDTLLTFNKAVRILFPGKAGKSIGFCRKGIFTEITTIISEDSQTAGDALPPGGDGKIDVGADLVVWTKHFTKYVVYEQTTAGACQLLFSAAMYSVNKNMGNAIITVTRSGDSTGAVSVSAAACDGSAKAGIDYSAITENLTFDPGVASKAFKVPILGADLPGGDITVNLTLSNPTAGAILGSQSTATLAITEASDTTIPGDSQYKLWPDSTATGGVAADKLWQVKFNQELDISTIKGNSVFICRTGTKEQHPVTLEISSDPGSTIVKLRPAQPFAEGGSYELFVRSLKSKSGASLAQAVRVPFTVTAPPPDDSQYTLWSGSTATEDVAVDKEWRIKFNQELDTSTINDTSAYICKAVTGKRHPVAVEIENEPDNRAATMKVKPVRPYTGGGGYVLYIDKTIKSKTGTNLAQGIKMYFSAQGDGSFVSSGATQKNNKGGWLK